MLEARALRQTFARTVALDGVPLEIGAGEIVAITGPSGSGKSTLLHCLAGIIRPESGEVLFAGKRIDTLGESERTTCAGGASASSSSSASWCPS
ncbi:ATP-binding cassette domain-containing protein [Nonomuraea aurantiaca]|uniref:ATP-binding cassette domain-containing protein n=1 Tax=Nonomuraea aurantiaca TaxID=2878562 RepID=UPI003FD7BA9E